jgi:uncharacterized phage-associated protein
MTLLKVLYFAHGWHLAKYGKPLVVQPFEAWQYGPVNRVVYDQLKWLGAKPIKERLKSFDPVACEYRDATAAVDGETERFLCNIFDYYGRFDGLHLSDLTHVPGSPWDAVWQAAETRAVPGMIIPDPLILEWFQGEGRRVKRPQ